MMGSEMGEVEVEKMGSEMGRVGTEKTGSEMEWEEEGKMEQERV